VINRRFPYLHIAFILLLSIVFIPPAFAIEARYVKVLIDATLFPSCCGRDGLIKITELQVLDSFGNNLSLNKPTMTATPGFHPSSNAVDGNLSTSYATTDGTGSTPGGGQWLLVDLGSTSSIAVIRLSTSASGGFGFAVLTDYRVIVSENNLNWELVGVVTNQPNTTRTDTVILQDLSTMDIDINYVTAFFLTILFLGFFRQIFF